MRITLLAEGYPPMSGGVATSARRLAVELVRQGHEVTVLTFDNMHDITVPDLCVTEVDMGARICRIGPFFLKNKSVSAKVGMLTEKHKAMLRRRAFNQMLRILENDRPDILLSFYLFNAGFMAQLLANALGLPVVAGVRGNDIGRNIFDSERFAAVRWTVDSADAVACVNRHLMERVLIAFPEVRDKVLITKNGLLPEQFQRCGNRAERRAELVGRMGWDERDLILNFTGSLREKKGVITLVRALTKVNRERTHIRLMVTGPDLGKPERLMVGDLWERLKGRNIICLSGQVDRGSVPELVSACDMACYPSNEDGMANGLLESMALGLPSIVSTIFDDVVTDGREGLVIPYDDEQRLVDAMEQAYADRETLASMGQSAYETASTRFTAEDEARTYIDLFSTILEQRRVG